MKTKPNDGGPASIWCAMCGQWTDHGSGSCPELHPDAMAEPNPPAVAQERPTPITDKAEIIARQEYEQYREAGDPPFNPSGFDAAREMEKKLAEANEKLNTFLTGNEEGGLEYWKKKTFDALHLSFKQVEEIERLRAVLKKIRSPFNCMTRGETCELINAALAAPSGHLVAQIPQNMNNKPGYALGLSDNSSGPRMVRREVLERLVIDVKSSVAPWYLARADDAMKEAETELARTAPDKAEGEKD